MRAKLSPAEEYITMLYEPWWHRVVIPPPTESTPVFTELVAALNDLTGNSQMNTEVR
jgi:hypothetical protein